MKNLLKQCNTTQFVLPDSVFDDFIMKSESEATLNEETEEQASIDIRKTDKNNKASPVSLDNCMRILTKDLKSDKSGAHGCDEDTKKQVTIRSYFKGRGFEIEKATIKSNTPQSIVNLSTELSVNYPGCTSFVRYIRDSLSNKRQKCDFNISGLSKEERKTTQRIAKSLNNYGIIADLRVTENGNIIGSFPFVPGVTKFIEGDFLEIYAADILRDVVAKKALALSLDYEVLINVHIKNKTGGHELDAVFRLGNEIFWCEVKSGKFSDFNKYYRIGKMLGLNPDKHILLTAEKDIASCDALSYFYRFYVSNIPTFECKLKEMIDNTFR